MSVIIEEEMRSIWIEVLKCGEVNDGSDFFDLGGSSIQAVYVAALVQERLAIPLDAIDVVMEPNFAKLCTAVKDRASAE